MEPNNTSSQGKFMERSFDPDVRVGGRSIAIARPGADAVWRPQPLTHALRPGLLGHTWFAGAVGLVATVRLDLLASQFVLSRPEDGSHAIQFHMAGRNGIWIVDDRVPLPPVFTHAVDGTTTTPATPHLAWLSLLEKAYVRRHGGSYERLCQFADGRLAEALNDITSCPVLTYPVPGATANTLWDLVQSRVARGCVVGAVRTVPDSDPDGIACAVPYGVLATYDLPAPLGKVCMVVPALECPPWTGRLSRQSPQFASLPDSVRSAVDRHPRAVFIAFEDMMAKFSEFLVVEAAPLGEEPFRASGEIGEWLGESAAGPMGSPGFFNNPQYSITTGDQRCRMLITLNQPDSTFARQNYKAIGFVVLKTPGPHHRMTKSAEGDLVCTSGPFVATRDVVVEVELEPNQSYVIIPSTQEAGVVSRFVLSARSTQRFEWVALQPGPDLLSQ